jgi:predicted GTPase
MCITAIGGITYHVSSADAQGVLPHFLFDTDEAPSAPQQAAQQQQAQPQAKIEKLLRLGLVGIPNAGKSTLTNLLVGGTVSAVSIRPETTRRAALGAFNDGNTQVWS